MNELRVNGQTASEYGKAYAETAIDALVTESPAIAEFTLRHLEEAVLACPNRTFGDDPDDSLVEFVTEATEAANDYLCKAQRARFIERIRDLAPDQATDAEIEALLEIDHVEGLQADDAEAALAWFRSCHDRHAGLRSTDCDECIEESIKDTHPIFACEECCEVWEADDDEIRVMAYSDGTFGADCPHNEEHARMMAEPHFDACDDPNCPDVVRHFSEQSEFTIGRRG